MDEQRFACSRSRIFDAALQLAQTWNLRVSLLEKESGFIEFKSSPLSPEQLDLYCTFPVEYADIGEPLMSFSTYSSTYGRVRGTTDLTLLLTAVTADLTSANLRSHWLLDFGGEIVRTSSSGIFEDEFMQKLQHVSGCAWVGGPSAGTRKKLTFLRSLAKEQLLDQEDYMFARNQLLGSGQEAHVE